MTNLRLRVLPKFPARIVGTDGLEVVRDGAGLIVRPAFGSLAEVSNIPDSGKTMFLAWNKESGEYNTITFQSIFDNSGNSAGYATKGAAQVATISLAVHAIELFGSDVVGDGNGGLYIDSNNGSADTFVSGDGRTWYRAADVGTDRIVDGAVPFATIAELEAANIPASILFVEAAGYYAAGDGGGASYVRVVSEPAHAGKVQSADGAWWELSEPEIHVEMFGAVSYTEAQMRSLAGLVIDNGPAIQAAMDFMATQGGGRVLLGSGFYPSRKLRYPNGVYLEGVGYGKWMPSFPTEAKTWTGTNLIALGNGVRDYTAPGITSCEFSGGHRTDPDNPARKFKLTSFMNRDAVGTTAATPKAMSVFIANKTRHGDMGGVLGCRIVPWIGVDGISDYDNQAIISLGGDWDVGLLIDTMEGVHVNVQVRGYWRMLGLGEISPDFDTWSRSEANLIEGSAQGFVGATIRSGSQCKVLASTASTVEILFEPESIWPPSGQINLINAGYVTYTSLSRNGANLVFNGLSADPAGSLYLRNPYRGTGFSTGAFNNFEAWALWHHSGLKAEALGFGKPSSGMEISGFPMRGLNMYNVSIFGEDNTSPNLHMHNVFDFNFTGGKAEIGHIIASPFESAQALPLTATGSTSNLGFQGFQLTGSVRTELFNPRSIRDLQRQWNPLARNSGDFLLEALPLQDWLARIATGKRWVVQKSDGAAAISVTDAGNLLIEGGNLSFTSGVARINFTTGQAFTLREGTTTAVEVVPTTRDVLPGADGAQRLGRQDRRWSQLHSNTMWLADGVTAPGVIAGMAGLFVDAADGDLKIKFSDGVVKTIVVDT